MNRRGKKQSTDMGLNMECIDEDLTPAQLAFYCKGEAEFKEISAKLDLLVKNSGAEIVEKVSDDVFVLQLNSTIGNAAPTPAAQPLATPVQTVNAKNNVRLQGPQSIQIPKNNSVLIQNPSQSVVRAGNSYQLVMDPRSGLIVGVNQPPPLQKSAPPGKTAAPLLQKAAALPVKQTTVLKTQTVSQPTNATRSMPVRTMPVRTATKPSTPVPVVPAKSMTPVTLQTGAGRGKARQVPQPTITPINLKPTEGNSVGGLVAGGNKLWKPVAAPVVDLTNEDNTSRQNSGFPPDSREVVFSKMSGKTFPSLVVVARPYLRVKDLSSSVIAQGRTTLDAKVKQVLMFTPTKFTEWLIQQGYVPSEQSCNTHKNPDRSPIKLKLGMYSDVSKFPFSGGYVWISECCPHRFVSVFHGSVFEGAPHPPTVLLKLLYHWSCQTNVQNVAQWVKVDNYYVKNFFGNMRAVCTSAVHEKYEKMGGPRKRVEVGVISLGTTSQDGNMRQVKVEVLGVMEAGSKMVRLRAVEPLADGEKNYKRRFVKILEPLEKWVEKDSVILTDFTVDKGTLHNMGFGQVYQVSPSSEANSASNVKYSNANVMEYLRRIVPRMFQNTLSLLSREIIQQFLDELVWRERWGPIPSQCFENILQHLSEQTKLEAADNFLMRLSGISADPFKCWAYSTFTAPGSCATLPPAAGASRVVHAPLPQPAAEVRSGIDMLPASIRTIDPPAAPNKRGRKRLSTEPLPAPAKRPATEPAQAKRQSTDTKTSLESYYYATMEGDPNIVKKEIKATAAIKCAVCPRKYSNNMEVMVHLFLHAEMPDMVISTTTSNVFCRYCLKSFPTSWQLTQHVDQTHPRANTVTIVCRICEQEFPDRTTLIEHMYRWHICTELPYECSVCTYRSSLHREVIDHFYETHSGGENLQCPLCLKVVSYTSGGRNVEQNLMFFVTHMQKHFRQAGPRKCPKCVLAFVHKGMLKDHLDGDHRSFAGQPGVRVFVQTNGSDCIMNLPDQAAVVSSSGPSGGRARGAHTSSRFSVELCGARGKCNECSGQLDEADHFPGVLRCGKCRYMTCCSRAMSAHHRIFHNKQAKAVEVANLPAEMHCVCGYKSCNGNQLAKHMALCERKTAYLSPSCAQMSTRTTPGSASFPPLVTLDEPTAEGDLSDRWLKAFNPGRKEDAADAADAAKKPSASGPPSMLNMLGLVRRSSTEEPPEPQPDKECKSDESTVEPEKAEVKDAQVEEKEVQLEETLEKEVQVEKALVEEAQEKDAQVEETPEKDVQVEDAQLMEEDITMVEEAELDKADLVASATDESAVTASAAPIESETVSEQVDPIADAEVPLAEPAPVELVKLVNDEVKAVVTEPEDIEQEKKMDIA